VEIDWEIRCQALCELCLPMKVWLKVLQRMVWKAAENSLHQMGRPYHTWQQQHVLLWLSPWHSGSPPCGPQKGTPFAEIEASVLLFCLNRLTPNSNFTAGHSVLNIQIHKIH
jgi:hypothetical protein